jgi:membrane-associated phospholipid phosphatase
VVLVVLLMAGLLAGALAALAASRYPRGRRGPEPRPGRLAARLDPETATGLALTLALVVLVGGGLLLAVLAFVIRSDPDAIGLDAGAANWASRHRTGAEENILDVITYVGRPGSIVVLAVLLGVVVTVRTRSRWVIPFLLLVVAGNGIITTTIKSLADRVRPTLNPAAATLGPSFPSGHSSWSAAFFAAAALLLARGRGRRALIVLAGLAVGAAVTIAATRVLLDVHWLSDVVAGLALGWAWFAACAIAFGGRLLRFGAEAEALGARDAPAAHDGAGAAGYDARTSSEGEPQRAS